MKKMAGMLCQQLSLRSPNWMMPMLRMTAMNPFISSFVTGLSGADDNFCAYSFVLSTRQSKRALSKNRSFGVGGTLGLHCGVNGAACGSLSSDSVEGKVVTYNMYLCTFTYSLYFCTFLCLLTSPSNSPFVQLFLYFLSTSPCSTSSPTSTPAPASTSASASTPASSTSVCTPHITFTLRV